VATGNKVVLTSQKLLRPMRSAKCETSAIIEENL
jgi:hypothetical protein